VIYAPGGFTRPHYHAGTVTAYIVRGVIKSQLQGGPLETFTVGQTFFEPPGSVHMVSANASDTEDAELLAIIIADEGAQLTTFLSKGAWPRPTDGDPATLPLTATRALLLEDR